MIQSRFKSIIIALAAVLLPAFAQAHTYVNGFCTDEGCESPYESATLNDDGYYEITNGGQLFWFATQVSTETIKAIVTVSEIDLENRNWSPIGKYGSTPFIGVFNGGGATIKGFKIEASSSSNAAQGFFGVISGSETVVSDFTLQGSITASGAPSVGRMGSVAGYGLNGALIQDVTSEVNIDLTGSNWKHSGGIVSGDSTGSQKIFVNRCRYSGNFNSGNGDDCVGGIAGYVSGASSKVTNCLFDGSITAGTSAMVGGIVSYVPNGVKIQNNLSVGKVTGGSTASNKGVGAILARASGSTTPSPNLVGTSNNYFANDQGFSKGVYNGATSDDGYCTGAALSDFANGEGTYLAKLGTANWTQTDFSSGYPIPSKTGYVCPHTNHSNGFCSFCGLDYEEPAVVDGVYQIANGGNLFWYATMINGQLVDGTTTTVTYNAKVTTSTLDLESKDFPGIGSYNNGNSLIVSGTFDGNGATITGFYMKVASGSITEGAALFNCTGNITIKDFTIEGSIDINTGYHYVGSIIGRSTSNGNVIEHVWSKVNITSNINSTPTIGGLVGYANVDLRRCRYSGTINLKNGYGSNYGGLLGQPNNNDGTYLSDCLFDGAINSTYVHTDETIKLTIGGLVGSAFRTTSITDCLMAGTITYATSITTRIGVLTGNTEEKQTVTEWNVHYVPQGDLAVNAITAGTINSKLVEETLGSERMTGGTTLAELGNNWTQDTNYPVPAETAAGENYRGYLHIRCEDELKLFRDWVNAGQNAIKGVIDNDIDLTGDFGAPIGYGYDEAGTTDDEGTVTMGTIHVFKGVLDGQGFTINNLQISGDYQGIGLIGWMQAKSELKNLNINGSVTYAGESYKVGKSWGGSSGNVMLFMGTVGRCDGGSSITNVNSAIDFHVLNTYVDAAFYDDEHGGMPINFGGICGSLQGTSAASSQVELCTWTGSVGHTDAIEGHNGCNWISDCMGGIVGYATGYTNILECTFKGSIYNLNPTFTTKNPGVGGGALTNMITYVGGVLGYINSEGSTQKYNSSEGSVSGAANSPFVGTLVGIDRKPTQLTYNFYPKGTQAVGAGTTSIPSSASELNDKEVVACELEDGSWVVESYPFDDDEPRMFFPASMQDKPVSVKHVKYSRASDYVKGFMSVCMPFTIDATWMPSSDFKFYVYKLLGNGKVYISEVSKVAAGQPCFVYAADWDSQADWIINILNEDNPYPIELKPDNTGVLKGSFDYAEIGAGYYKLNSAGTKLFVTTDEAVCWEYRAYADIASMLPELEVMIAAADPSAVTDVKASNATNDDTIYNLQGMKMPTKDLNELPAGIYIQNHKKFMIK